MQGLREKKNTKKRVVDTKHTQVIRYYYFGESRLDNVLGIRTTQLGKKIRAVKKKCNTYLNKNRHTRTH